MSVWAVFPTPSVREAVRIVVDEWRTAGCKVAVLVEEDGEIDADLVLRLGEYRGYSWAMNRLCRAAVENGADIVVCVGDDLFPRDGWTADRLADEFTARFADTFGVMQCTGDMYGEIHHAAVSPAIGREFIRRMYGGAGPFHEGYWHLYTDRELQDVATKLGAFAQVPELTIYHDHWTRQETPDRLPERHRADIRKAAAADAKLYKTRSASGFPGHEPQ